ncbi:MAG: hypothetical protein Fur0034_17220 [Desulfuromonadia bacterium]
MTRQEKGFTLIELVVVLFILGLATLLVIPRLPSTPLSDLDRSADAVASLLRSVDQEAVVTKKTFRLRIVPGGGISPFGSAGVTNFSHPAIPSSPVLRSGVMCGSRR